ncbi:MAG: hypothetical protein J6U73_00365 [Alistipes sp.]|nr:hypothetical protein [Alistipes sp.]
MKNTIKLLMCAVMALCFASCTPDNGDDSSIKKFNFNTNVQGNTILVTWKTVESAIYYKIQLNDQEAIKVEREKGAYKFDNLDYDTTYTIGLTAYDAYGDPFMSDTKQVTIKPLVIYAYREWAHYASGQAISDNGKWITGAFDHTGMIIDLSTNSMISTEYFEGYDIDDNGVAVGSYHEGISVGVAAMCIGGEIIEIDLSNLTENNQMSCLTGITPDGAYAVGWYWNFDDANAYYAKIYGDIIPFCYDVINDTVSVPDAMTSPIYNDGAMSIYNIAPDGSMLGLDQQFYHLNVVWENEYTPYEYALLEYDAETLIPTRSMGHLDNRFSQSGRYIYGTSQLYEGEEQTNIPSVFDRETKTLCTYNADISKITAMADDGTVFGYSVPMGNTGGAYVTTIDNGNNAVFELFENWLLLEHNIDIAKYNPQTNTYEGTEAEPDPYLLDGTSVVGASADGRTLLCITQTADGWITSAICLDGIRKE